MNSPCFLPDITKEGIRCNIREEHGKLDPLVLFPSTGCRPQKEGIECRGLSLVETKTKDHFHVFPTLGSKILAFGVADTSFGPAAQASVGPAFFLRAEAVRIPRKKKKAGRPRRDFSFFLSARLRRRKADGAMSSREKKKRSRPRFLRAGEAFFIFYFSS